MNTLLQHCVTRQAERCPEAVALVMGKESMTYGQLEEASNQLGRLLRAAGCRKGDRVCFLMPKSLTAIVTMIGILKADCMHVPLDPANPATRLARIVGLCESRWLLAAGHLGNLLEELLCDRKFNLPVSIGWMGNEEDLKGNFRPAFSRRDLASYSGALLDSQNKPEDPAHILFTSGDRKSVV